MIKIISKQRRGRPAPRQRPAHHPARHDPASSGMSPSGTKRRGTTRHGTASTFFTALYAALSAVLCIGALTAIAPQTARAQNPLAPNIIPTLPDLPKPGGEILTQPECFEVISHAPFTINGSIFSNRYVRPDGQQAQHRFNFRLEPGQRQQVCAAGPFFEGRQLQLTLRTLIPLFTCRTAIYGPIHIHGRRNENGKNQMWAECLLPREP